MMDRARTGQGSGYDELSADIILNCVSLCLYLKKCTTIYLCNLINVCNAFVLLVCNDKLVDVIYIVRKMKWSWVGHQPPQRRPMDLARHCLETI